MQIKSQSQPNEKCCHAFEIPTKSHLICATEQYWNNTISLNLTITAFLSLPLHAFIWENVTVCLFDVKIFIRIHSKEIESILFLCFICCFVAALHFALYFIIQCYLYYLVELPFILVKSIWLDLWRWTILFTYKTIAKWRMFLY